MLDCWARFFKAITWEELNMLAKNNVNLKEAAATVHHLTTEEKIRMECEAREDYYRTQRDIQNMMDEQTAKIESLEAENQTQASEIVRLQSWIKERGYDPDTF